MFRWAAGAIPAVVTLLLCSAPGAAAGDRLCDPAAEDCRAILLDLIQREPTAIDVAFWFMEDARYSAAIARRAAAGVTVRVLVNPRSPSAVNSQILAQLAASGVPMRAVVTSGILHWKMMLFAGLGTVEFSGANYSPQAFNPGIPYRNYIDEAVFFTDDQAIVHSFMRRFDDLWIDPTSLQDYANIAGPLARRYPQYDVDPDLNFPPGQSYRNRAISRYRHETQGIDVMMYRLTDSTHTDAIIDAVERGVPVRLITEQVEYRNRARWWDSWNVDRLYMAGVQIRQRGHDGLSHQKSIILRDQGMVIFGSSNWTSPSSSSQQEHNYFATKPWIFAWFAQQFERKWNNLAGPETAPFAPLPPDAPSYIGPAAGQIDVPTQTDLVFDAGPFAHLYDVYFGTTPNPPLLEENVALGPTPPGAKPRRYTLPPLHAHTTYYWRIVAKTMAMMSRAQAVTSFTTGALAAPPPPPPPPAPPPTPPPTTPPAPTPPPPAPVPTACPSLQPAPNWICVNGGWVPPDSPLAGPPTPPTGPPPPAAPPPPAPGCQTIQPAPTWVCVNGGWVPPDSPLARGASAPTSPPPVPPVTPASPQTCLSIPPAAGWVCVSGGWVPPDHPLAHQQSGAGP